MRRHHGYHRNPSHNKNSTSKRYTVCEVERPRHLHTTDPKGASLIRAQHVERLSFRTPSHHLNPDSEKRLLTIMPVSVTCFRRLRRHATHRHNEASGKHGLTVRLYQLKTETRSGTHVSGLGQAARARPPAGFA